MANTKLVGAYRDSCEWNPEANRPAWTVDVGHAEATLILGYNGGWRLCESCAALPRFNQFKVRKQIKVTAEHRRREAEGR